MQILEHNNQAESLNELKEEMENVEQKNIVITYNKAKKQCRKMPNWKAPGQVYRGSG